MEIILSNQGRTITNLVGLNTVKTLIVDMIRQKNKQRFNKFVALQGYLKLVDAYRSVIENTTSNVGDKRSISENVYRERLKAVDLMRDNWIRLNCSYKDCNQYFLDDLLLSLDAYVGKLEKTTNLIGGSRASTMYIKESIGY